MKSTENEYLFNLRNVKLVLGNGFDLHCGLKTRYKDFFEFDNTKDELKNWYEKIDFNSLPSYFRSEISNCEQCGPKTLPNGTSVWMLFLF